MKKILLLASTFLFLCSTSHAVPFTDNLANDLYAKVKNTIPTAHDNDDGKPDIWQAINQVTTLSLTKNEDADDYFVEPDYTWSGTTGELVVIGLTAKYNNTLGYYNDVGIGSDKTSLVTATGFGYVYGEGTDSDPFTNAKKFEPADPFGWYLYADQRNYYYSDPGIHSDGFDHMMTFELPVNSMKALYVDFGDGKGSVEMTFNKPYLLAWEDLPFENGKLGDEDYDDTIFLVDKVNPVPEPTTMFLLGTGLIGMAAVGRKKFIKK